VSVCAAIPRSHGAKAAFQRLYHCPSTDKPRGASPGYVIDYVTPLCAGGADNPLNMQWQTITDAKAKDREEAQGYRHNPGGTASRCACPTKSDFVRLSRY
jgi:hypothetical protein